jgi:general secretion pathway protein D
MLRIATFITVLLLASCAHHPAYTEGMDLIQSGNVEAGLTKLEEATRREPGRHEYRQAYFRERDLAVQRYGMLAETARSHGQWDAAEAAYNNVLAIDPGHPRAKAGVELVRAERRHRSVVAEAEELLKKDDRAGAEARVRGVLAENSSQREAQQLLRRIEERALRAAASGPQLSASLKEPISLDFREATLRQLFEALARSTGLNFIFDRDVRQDLRTAIFVRNSSVEDVLRFVLVTNQLEKKILSHNTVLIYPNTVAKLRDYQDLVTKTFYLTNSDAKATATLLRTLVKTKDIYVDDKIRRQDQHGRDPRHARRGPHGRTAGRKPGPRRARGHAGSRSHGSGVQLALRAGDSLSGFRELQPRGRRGNAGDRDLA